MVIGARLCGALDKLAAGGRRALLLVWDKAPWHVSKEVRTWIRGHNVQVKQAGHGVRIIACYVPAAAPVALGVRDLDDDGAGDDRPCAAAHLVHLSVGEEAVAVGICALPSDKAYITSTQRGHGHCIAKGDSIHIATVNRGMHGANGIGTPAVAVDQIATVIAGFGSVTTAGQRQQIIGDIVSDIGGGGAVDAVTGKISSAIASLGKTCSVENVTIGQAGVGKQLIDSLITMA